MRKKTKAFADKLLANPTMSQAQAYVETHETDNKKAARVAASRLANSPAVLAYMEKHTEQAEKTIVQVMKNANKKDKKDSVQWQRLAYDTANGLLDRTHGKPLTKSINGNVNLSLEDLLANLT